MLRFREYITESVKNSYGWWITSTGESVEIQGIGGHLDYARSKGYKANKYAIADGWIRIVRPDRDQTLSISFAFPPKEALRALSKLLKDSWYERCAVDFFIPYINYRNQIVFNASSKMFSDEDAEPRNVSRFCDEQAQTKIHGKLYVPQVLKKALIDRFDGKVK